MELPARSLMDRFVPAGDFARLSARLRNRPENAAVPTLLISAFDGRTRMLPFLLADRQIVPAGIRAVSAALANAGFTRQRVVNQAWVPNVRPSTARLDGHSPELLLVSAMQIHSAPAYQAIRDALRMGADRPLIIVGGPKAIYQPWDYFAFDAEGSSADVVCTGEEFVLLELLDRLNESKQPKESLRTGFERARSKGWLDDIPGLVFARTDRHGAPRELIDTGVQRLLQDFDELPSPVLGYRFLERAHRGRTLHSAPVPLAEIRHYSKIASILTTRGCKFRCGYCPIPAYNQFSFRTKSPEGLVRDIAELRRQVGFHLFFGTDDNFFNDEKTVIATFEALVRAGFDKDDIGKVARFGTEGTEYDVYKQRPLLPLCYRGGLRAIWFGIEDMTAVLVNKGQSVSKTVELFEDLRRQRILPMAMMMHYDGQPLVSRDSMQGLLNQIRFLYRAGAGSVQVTVLGPAAGTKDYDEVMRSGIILKTLAGRHVDDWCWDGNHVISVGSSTTPWKLQRNVLLGYGLFYNPLNLARAIFRKHWKWSDLFLQVWGMWGLALTAWKLIPWMFRLRAVAQGRYGVYRAVPESALPIVPPAEPDDRHAERAAYVRQTVGAATGAPTGARSRRPSLTKY